MFEILEEINNQNKNFEWIQSDLADDLMKLKKLVEIAEKKNELWSMNGTKEQLIKLAKWYIDSMLNTLVEKQNDNEIKKNREFIDSLIRTIKNPDLPLEQQIIKQIADGNRIDSAKSVIQNIQIYWKRTWVIWSIINRLWRKDGIISNKLT